MVSVHRSDRRYFARFLKCRRGWQKVFAYGYERHRRARPGLAPIRRLAFFPFDMSTYAFYRSRIGKIK